MLHRYCLAVAPVFAENMTLRMLIPVHGAAPEHCMLATTSVFSVPPTVSIEKSLIWNLEVSHCPVKPEYELHCVT